MGGMQTSALDPHQITTIEAGDREYVIYVPHVDTDYIQSNLAQTHLPYEESMLKVMAQSLSKGDLVLDIGANIGNHTLYLAVVAGCRVIAYEPNTELVGPLQESIKLNDLGDRVRVRPVGVFSRPGHGIMSNLNPENLGSQKIELADRDGAFEIVRLDDEKFDSRVAAMKLDVEGAELEVLRGARELIRRDGPSLFVECGTVAEFRGVCDFMDEVGYSLVGTYNRTPTHHFIPGGGTPQEREVVHALVLATAERYALKEQIRALRERLEIER